jgi:L-threonylcarbamoyladenylate synthase
MSARIAAASPDAIAKAAVLLRAGALVAFPTETVYGLGADATNDAAVAAIFAVKGRPSFNPLICHVADVAAARRLVAFDARAERLAGAFWPGPLTLVLPRLPGCPVAPRVAAGLTTLAVRVPAHAVALALLRAVERPLAAPSANISGRPSPTAAPHVARDLGDRVALILDGGPCPVGVESTVVGLADEPARLLRPGGVPREAIEALIGPLAAPEGGPVAAPGMLTSHYAPELPLRLEARAPQGREALLAFGPDVPQGFAATLNLSPRGDLAEAAANLFAYLRALDRAEFERIAVMPIPQAGLGLAINDRLRRAAAPR